MGRADEAPSWRCRHDTVSARGWPARQEETGVGRTGGHYNGRVRHIVIAEVTTNLAPANDPAFVLIDVATPEGRQAGLDQNSLVSGLFLATVFVDRIDRVIGKLSPGLIAKVDRCLKEARSLP